jgi:predicted small secreted protein
MKTLERRALCGLAVLALALTGCNTIAGAGEDIEEGGEAIEETAEDTQAY